MIIGKIFFFSTAVFLLFLFIRGWMVYSFYEKVLCLDERIFNKLPESQEALFSLKPLRYKYWFSWEDAKILSYKERGGNRKKKV